MINNPHEWDQAHAEAMQDLQKAAAGTNKQRAFWLVTLVENADGTSFHVTQVGGTALLDASHMIQVAAGLNSCTASFVTHLLKTAVLEATE